MGKKESVIEMLEALENDKNFIILREKYEVPNCFNIMGKTRREEWQSNFVKWILDYEENHNLGDFAISRFFELVNKKRSESNMILIQPSSFDKMKIETEKAVEVGNMKGRIDIFGESDTLVLVIENKIDAKLKKVKGTNLYQTDLYQLYCEETHRNKDNCYVFLNPYSLHNIDNENYIVITYQELFDNVIKACIEYDGINQATKAVLLQYAIHVASSNVNGQKFLAFTEVDIAKLIYEKHKKAFRILKKEMENLNRDKNSIVCRFFDKYERYINLILGSLKEDVIIKRNEIVLKRQALLKALYDRGYIELDETMLVTSRNGATFTIQICKNGSKFYCYGGYRMSGKNVRYVKNPSTGDKFFETIGSAARAIQDECDYAAIGEKRSMNSGPAARQWYIINAKDESVEGMLIGQLGL